MRVRAVVFPFLGGFCEVMKNALCGGHITYVHQSVCVCVCVCERERERERERVFKTKSFVTFLWNTMYEFFTRSCRASMSRYM
jgi:hypothetical protein